MESQRIKDNYTTKRRRIRDNASAKKRMKRHRDTQSTDERAKAREAVKMGMRKIREADRKRANEASKMSMRKSRFLNNAYFLAEMTGNSAFQYRYYRNSDI